MGITVGFGVPGENNDGRSMIDFCAERGLSVNKTLSTRVLISTPGWLETKMEWK